MRCTFSTQARLRKAALAHSAEIDIQLEADGALAKTSTSFDILLIEAEGTEEMQGLLRQMSLINHGGYTGSDRNALKETIFLNIVERMRIILDGMTQLNISLRSENLGYRDFILSLGRPNFGSEPMPERVVDAIGRLSRDPAMETALQRSDEFKLPQADSDSARYYFRAIDRIGDVSYLPSDQDILRSSMSTVAIRETGFRVGELTYRVCDMSSQWRGWKKWIHHFEGMAAILFLVDLSAYDKKTMESTTSYMDNALQMFETICNSGPFSHSSKILFMNNVDIFAEKLSRIPLKDYFPDYNGGQNFDAACDYLLHRFVSVNRTTTTTQIYAHYTSMTDTKQIKFVLSAVQDICLQQYLRKEGLL